MEGGYCQSMNFMAALLLMYMDNELAFYTQVCLTRNLFNGYFTDELVSIIEFPNPSLECVLMNVYLRISLQRSYLN